MPLEGNVRTFGLDELVQNIAMNKHTGMVYITCREEGSGEGEGKRIFFEGGKFSCITNASSPTIHFPSLLPKIGILSKERVAAALEASQEPEPQKVAAKILVESGLMPEKILRSIVYKFYENELYEILLWKDADYIFELGVLATDFFPEMEGYAFCNVVADQMIMDLLRKLDEYELLKKKVGSLDSFYRVLPQRKGELEGLKLNPVQRRFLERLDGTHSLNDIRDKIFIGLFEMYQLLDILMSRRIVEKLLLSDLKSGAKSALEANQREAAIRLLRGILKLVDHIELRVQLAKLYREEERWEESFEEYFSVGREYMERGETRKALEYFRQAARIRPSSAQLQYWMAKSFLVINDLEEAKKSAYTLYQILRESEEYSWLEEVYQELYRRLPEDLGVRSILAEIFSHTNRPQAMVLYEDLAKRYEQKGQMAKALRVYKAMLRLNPHHQVVERVQYLEAKAGGSRWELFFYHAQYYLIWLVIAIFSISFAYFFFSFLR